MTMLLMSLLTVALQASATPKLTVIYYYLPG